MPRAADALIISRALARSLRGEISVNRRTEFVRMKGVWPAGAALSTALRLVRGGTRQKGTVACVGRAVRSGSVGEFRNNAINSIIAIRILYSVLSMR